MVSFGYTNQSCERCFTPMAGTLRIQMHTLNSLMSKVLGKGGLEGEQLSLVLTMAGEDPC